MRCPACKNEVGMPIAYCGTGFVPADQAQQCMLCGSIFPLFFWKQTTEANKDLTSCKNCDIMNIEKQKESV